MESDVERRVVTWLHLGDREEVGDFYIREVWKSVELRPTGNLDYCGRCVPLFEEDAKALLSLPGGQLRDELYRRLGVTTLESFPGLPKGPYYDPVDTAAIHASLSLALQAGSDGSEPTEQKDVVDLQRNWIWTVRDQLVESVRHALRTDPEVLHRLPPRDFERLVAEILRDMGYDVCLTPETRDGS